ncbi:MAG: hypothetical protein WBA12_05455 [Catalinimonas sp.]
MLRHFFFLLGGVVICAATAQTVDVPVSVSYGDRIEFPVEQQTTRPPIVLPVGEDGVVYLLQAKRPQDRFSYRWQFVHCDTNLRERWRGDYLLTNDQMVRAYHQDHKNLYLLFTKQNSFDHIVYQVNLRTGAVVVNNIYALLNVNFDDLFVSGDDLLLQGLLNGRPVVVHHDLNSRRSRVLSSIYGNNAEIDDIYADPYSGRLHVTVAGYRRRKSRLFENIYAPGGDLISSREVTASSRDRNLLSARLVNPSPERQIMVGTYSDQSLYFPQGTFVVRRDPDGETEPLMNDFTEFDNFFNHLKPNRRERIQRRIFRKQERGKEFRVRYRFLVHDLVPVGDDHYLFVAEAYYPQYRSEASATITGYGTYRVFDGFRHTHVFLCLLDADGRRIWDNSLVTPKMTSFELQELATVQAHGDTVSVVLRDDDNEVSVHQIVSGKLAETPMTLEVPRAHLGDEFTKTRSLHIHPWYGDRLLVWGEQRVVNRRVLNGALNRDVYFLSGGGLLPLPVQTQGE